MAMKNNITKLIVLSTKNKESIMTGQDIRTIREQLGLSQREFGERLGVKRLAVARWESGTRTPDEANQKRLVQIAQENGLDTKLEIVSSNDENVSSKVDTLDTKTENVSSKVDTNSETGYNVDTKSQSVSSEQDTPANEKVTSEQVQAYYETMYSDLPVRCTQTGARGVISLCTIEKRA
jgi:DNA-binding transcriptional regulator YiaG